MIGDEMSHAFPMLRAGGLFIMVAGLGVALGGIFPHQRKLLLALGGGLATVVICLSASALSQPFGPPSNMQIAALVGSIALELLLIALVIKRFRPAGERTFFLAILSSLAYIFSPWRWLLAHSAWLSGLWRSPTPALDSGECITRA